MPRLADLKASFVQHKTGIADEDHGRPQPDGTTQWGGFEIETMHHTDILAEVHGIFFGCPLCYVKNGNSMKGTHYVLVSFAGRNFPAKYGSRDSNGKPSRWEVSGTGYDDLVCTPSIYLKGPGCEWHGFIGSSGVPPGHAV